MICGSSGTARATGKPLSDWEKMCPHIKAAGAKQACFILLGEVGSKPQVAMRVLVSPASLNEYIEEKMSRDKLT